MSTHHFNPFLSQSSYLTLLIFVFQSFSNGSIHVFILKVSLIFPWLSRSGSSRKAPVAGIPFNTRTAEYEEDVLLESKKIHRQANCAQSGHKPQISLEKISCILIIYRVSRHWCSKISFHVQYFDNEFCRELHNPSI